MEKQTLCSLCGKQNHIICEATSWDPNFVVPVSCPLTMYFSKWELNCSIEFPNATFTKQKRQSKQKLPAWKGSIQNQRVDYDVFQKQLNLSFQNKELYHHRCLRTKRCAAKLFREEPSYRAWSMHTWWLLSPQRITDLSTAWCVCVCGGDYSFYLTSNKTETQQDW